MVGKLFLCLEGRFILLRFFVVGEGKVSRISISFMVGFGEEFMDTVFV